MVRYIMARAIAYYENNEKLIERETPDVKPCTIPQIDWAVHMPRLTFTGIL